MSKRDRWLVLVQDVENAGWRIEKARKGHCHLVAYSPDGETIVQFAQGNDPRLYERVRARFRRHGLQI